MVLVETNVTMRINKATGKRLLEDPARVTRAKPGAALQTALLLIHSGLFLEMSLTILDTVAQIQFHLAWGVVRPSTSLSRASLRCALYTVQAGRLSPGKSHLRQSPAVTPSFPVAAFVWLIIITVRESQASRDTLDVVIVY